MATINKIDSLRYQVYALTKDGELDKPITMPILTREEANKYFSDCIQCALVSIDKNGTIVEVLDKDETVINKHYKLKGIKRRK